MTGIQLPDDDHDMGRDENDAVDDGKAASRSGYERIREGMEDGVELEVNSRLTIKCKRLFKRPQPPSRTVYGFSISLKL
jgi:hypothetical protein